MRIDKAVCDWCGMEVFYDPDLGYTAESALRRHKMDKSSFLQWKHEPYRKALLMEEVTTA